MCSLNQGVLTNDTSYLLCGFYCEDFPRNWLCYNGITLYQIYIETAPCYSPIFCPVAQWSKSCVQILPGKTKHNRLAFQFNNGKQIVGGWRHQSDGLVQDSSISSANTLEILQSCTKSSNWSSWYRISFSKSLGQKWLLATGLVIDK